MINVFIFLLHAIFIYLVMRNRIKNRSVKDAFIDLAFIIVLFAVGWSLTAWVINAFVEPEGLGKHFDRDTITLIFLSIGEFFFYKGYYSDVFVSGAGKGK